MAFLDELGKVISDKSKEAANKVKDITGVIQLKSKLSAEKEKVNKAYISLGKAYYDRHEAALEDEYADEFKLCSQVRVGSRVRQILSGIKANYTPEEMVGKKVMVVTNLKPAKLAGMLSEGIVPNVIHRKTTGPHNAP